MVGGWEISDADRDRRCPLTFSAEPAPGGFKIDFDAGCPHGAFRRSRMSWPGAFGPKDVLRLLDAKGGAVMEFTEVENGMFKSERGGWALVPANPGSAQGRHADRGADRRRLNLLREADKPLCRLTLSDTASGDGFRVVVKPGCDKAIAAFDPSTWRLDRDQLILAGRGGTWRFAESDATVWERVPLSVDPLLLVRQ